MRSIIRLIILCCAIALPAMACAEPLERGTAITDPLALRALDLEDGPIGFGTGLGLNRMLGPAPPMRAPIANDVLFALPAMAAVRQAIDDEVERYALQRRGRAPGETVGTRPSFEIRLFDRSALTAPDARFVLAGIVNRMDRAYVAPQDCGEVRVIYRLTRTSESADQQASPRLPMTLSVVFKARGSRAAGKAGSAMSCAEIARRWLATAGGRLSGTELAAALMSTGGALALIDPDDIDRLETNLQVAYLPKSSSREFETDYLLKVFRRNPLTHRFEEAALENQIDRNRILADADLRREFRTWLLDPGHLRDLDRGTIVIPEQYLATSAIAATPAGFDRSERQPAFGLIGPADSGAPFQDGDLVAALKAAAEQGIALENIRSVAGFERRLNDVTCSGCHQTRAIGGFHLPGADWMTAHPSNAATVPGSPHFFGDQVRRRDILAAIRDGRAPDYSRGFSDRPQLRGSDELLGTAYYDGWGSHCYDNRTDTSDNDTSFQSWRCASGLACQAAGKTSRAARIGMCFVAGQ